MLLAAYLVVFLLTLALIVSVARLADLLPQYAEQMQDAVVNAGNTLRDLGVKQDQIDAVVDAVDPGQLVDVVTSVLSSSLGMLTDLFFLLTVLIFMTFDTDSTRRGLASLGKRFPDPVAALANFAQGTRRYMVVSAGFGLIVAVIDGVALQIMGVPGAFVWAVLAFVTNFIPNIGFAIGVIPPALIALLDSGAGPDDRGHRRLQRDQLRDPVGHPAARGRRHGRALPDPDLPVRGVLDLGDRATGRAARRTAQPAHQGAAGRSRPGRTLGPAPDRRQSGPDRRRRSRRRRSHPRSLGPPPRFGWEELGEPGPPILADAPGTYVFDN